jgi:L-amino acid N-acyltransferase YncA
MSKTSILANTRIRLANTKDAAAILAIYSPFCLADSPVSFEFVPPSVIEMAERIEKTLASLPWLVWVEDGNVSGYAYASAHRQRAAYQWSVDVSAYIDASKRNAGVGSGLYSSLFEILRLQGYFNAYAGITLPNPASVRLHEKMGFSPVGTYRQVGYKGGSWHDVAWYELCLQAKVVNPPAPTPLTQIDFI